MKEEHVSLRATFSRDYQISAQAFISEVHCETVMVCSLRLYVFNIYSWADQGILTGGGDKNC
jgi:hypothetical protein